MVSITLFHVDQFARFLPRPYTLLATVMDKLNNASDTTHTIWIKAINVVFYMFDISVSIINLYWRYLRLVLQNRKQVNN